MCWQGRLDVEEREGCVKGVCYVLCGQKLKPEHDDRKWARGFTAVSDSECQRFIQAES
jgi:hypothetical protein